MSTLEFEEKSVEDAIDLACQQLKLPREKLEIEIISKGSSGIFGIVGMRKAKIRVTTKTPLVGQATEKAKEVLDEMLKHIDLPLVVECDGKRGIQLPEYNQQRFGPAHRQAGQDAQRTPVPGIQDSQQTGRRKYCRHS